MRSAEKPEEESVRIQNKGAKRSMENSLMFPSAKDYGIQSLMAPEGPQIRRLSSRYIREKMEGVCCKVWTLRVGHDPKRRRGLLLYERA